jgi:hypothetical protein
MVKGNSSHFFIPEQLMEIAIKRHGCSDFGDDVFLDGFKILCHSLTKESRLHPFGHVVSRKLLLWLLHNRLELTARWKEYPKVLEIPVKQPIFIIGPPRTGSTLLFNLLALDDRFRFIRSWEASRPGLPRGDKKRIKKAKSESRRTIGLFNYMHPGLKKTHHLAPQKPEECVPLLLNSFESDFFSFVYRSPAYFDWYYSRNHDYCYSYYYKQLQWIQSKKPGKRWLLKSSEHLNHFETLFKIFPDALALQTHRDPKQIVSSINRLKYNFQSMGTYNVNKKKINEASVNMLSKSLKAVFEFREKCNCNVFDIQHIDIVKNPIDILEKVYAYMGESLSYSMKACAKNYLATASSDIMEPPQNNLGETDAEKKRILKKFDFYYDHFKFATI